MIGAIWAAIKALSWGDRLKGLGSAVLAWAMRNPWPALCLLLATGNVVGVIVHRSDRAEIAADQVSIARISRAQADATRAAQAAHDSQQAAFVAKASEADHAHQSLATRSAVAADRYIADHACRVQPAPTGGAGGKADAPGQSDGARVPAHVPTDAIVVSAGDVRTCTAWVDYGIAAHDWAGTLNPP